MAVADRSSALSREAVNGRCRQDSAMRSPNFRGPIGGQPRASWGLLLPRRATGVSGVTSPRWGQCVAMRHSGGAVVQRWECQCAQGAQEAAKSKASKAQYSLK